MDYIEVNIVPEKAPDQEVLDTIIALLSEQPFESFAETENGVSAYMPQNLFVEKEVVETLNSIRRLVGIKWEINSIAGQNWNKTWEENYRPVTIAGRCYIRAPFHSSLPEMEYEILIEPKMSFGTAHHETTSMMIEMLLDEDVKGKDVLDMGCGTGVLAILASKMGAGNILAVDNDEWAYENALENVAKNECRNVMVKWGDEKAIGNQKFDLILANINRNILLLQLEHYIAALNPGGKIFLSGFYEKDIPVLLDKAKPFHYHLIKKQTKNHWAAIAISR